MGIAMQLREYQADAVAAVYDHARTRSDNPCVVIPTGGGKTPVIAQMCKDTVARWGGRVLVLAHVKELLQQSHEKITAMDPTLDVGIYSAGLKSRDASAAVVVAGIQSVYKRACDLGAFNVIIVDEAHMIPPSGDGMYQEFLADAKVINPRVRVVGLTATPYRLTSGEICTKDGILNHICYEIGVRELIEAGYLSKLVSRMGGSVDTAKLHIRGGEYIEQEVEALVDTEDVVNAACAELARRTKDRRSCLIFCASVAHAQHVAQTMWPFGKCEVVTGETPADKRAEVLDSFRAGALKYLANVNVLTTGFDAPGVDCVALLRPTASPGLYYQMVGRGFRKAEGKTDCLVLDFAGNVERLGPVDRLQPIARGGGGSSSSSKEPNRCKACPQCGLLVDIAYDLCPDCGTPFPPPAPKHVDKPAEVDIISGANDSWIRVDSVSYTRHTKRDNPDAPPTMRVNYRCGFQQFSEWVCVEHTGFAKAKAVAWMKERTEYALPGSVVSAVSAGEAGVFREPYAITVGKEGKYDRITGYSWKDDEGNQIHKPCPREPGMEDDVEIVAAPFDRQEAMTAAADIRAIVGVQDYDYEQIPF
jgi:DNA repair protein RadD